MKKLLYLFVLVIGFSLFNSCSKSDGQVLNPSQKISSSEKEMAVTSSGYIIVFGTSTSALSSAVNSKLASSSLYKLAGGPFLYHIGGTEYLGQALYK